MTMDDQAHYVDCWLKLEEIYKKGDKIKAIGVSNFNLTQMKTLLEKASVVPQMQQIECHGYENMASMVKFCHEHKIQVTAYSPLGNPGRPAGLQKGQDVLMEDPVVFEISNDDIQKINGLTRGIKYVYPDRFEPSKFFPFNKENKSAHPANYSE